MISRRKNFRTYNLALSANVERTLAVAGNMYAVISNTSEFTIIFDESNRLEKQSSGMGAKFNDEYRNVIVKSVAAQNVTIVLGYGEFEDARASVNATVNTTIENSNVINSLAEVSVGAGATVLIANANANRKQLRVGVKSSAANGVYIGSASSGASTPGGYIEEGTVDYVETEAAVYAYNAGASAVVVNVLELERV